MNVSVEISMYPLREDYISPIDNFLEQLHSTEGIEVKTNVMSTQVFGSLEKVFPAVQDAIKSTYGEVEHCSFVMKVLNGDVSGMEIKDY